MVPLPAEPAGAGVLDPQHVVIVGAGPGIGAAVARRFAAEGYGISLIARDTARLDLLAEGLRESGARVGVIGADAADAGELRAAMGEASASGVPGVLVYNAAMLRPTALPTVSAEELATGYAVDVIGAVVAAQAVLPAMRSAGSGTIILTGGSAGVRPSRGIATVSMGKAALRSAGIMLAEEVGPDGVHVASVTVSGAVRPGTRFDPDRIAALYWRLHTEPRERWTPVVPFDGADAEETR